MSAAAGLTVAFQRKKPAAIGTKAPFPGFVEPALASSIEKVPSGDRWVQETKFDGYRVQLHITTQDTKVFTRNGYDWTNRFKKVANDAFLINASSAVIDGEIVVPATDGSTDFSVLQNELKAHSTKIVMVAFDLLYLNGYDCRKKADRQYEHSIQRKFRDRRPGDVPPCLQGRSGRRSLQSRR